MHILETHYHRSRHTERLVLRELTHRVSNELVAVTALVPEAIDRLDEHSEFGRPTSRRFAGSDALTRPR